MGFGTTNNPWACLCQLENTVHDVHQQSSTVKQVISDIIDSMSARSSAHLQLFRQRNNEHPRIKRMWLPTINGRASTCASHGRAQTN